MRSIFYFVLIGIGLFGLIWTSFNEQNAFVAKIEVSTNTGPNFLNMTPQKPLKKRS